MADTDVLDLLFNTSNGIISNQSEKNHQADMMLPDQALGEFQFDLDEITKQFPLVSMLQSGCTLSIITCILLSVLRQLV